MVVPPWSAAVAALGVVVAAGVSEPNLEKNPLFFG